MDLDDEELKATRKMKGLSKMSSDEMFEKLCYKKHENEYAISYKRNNVIIEICKIGKRFRKFDEIDESAIKIDIAELKCIIKKFREMGVIL